MRLVWEGDMTKFEDIVKFRIIIENTHTWAMRVFKPLMASYIDQWKHVHCQTVSDTANAALIRRQQNIESCQTVLPIVQSLLGDHSSFELDDGNHPKVTPMLLGLLVQQICTSERQVLASEIDRIVTERLRACPHPDKSTFKGTTTATQQTSHGRRKSADSDQTGLPSPGPTIDNDDPDDSDYEESQFTGTPRSSRPITEPLENESELRRSTRSNPLGPLGTRSPNASLYQSPWAEEEADTSNTRDRASTPLWETSDTSTPASNKFTTQAPFDSPTAGAATPKPMQSLHPSDQSASIGKDATKITLFNSSSEKWPRGRLFPQLRSSPEPPKTDWKSDLRSVQYNFVYAPASRLPDVQPISSPSTTSQANVEKEERNGKKSRIDLTSDSQDS